MNFNIIVAYCQNRGIGINNTLPWKIRSDLKKFYKLTTGNGKNAIIMGKNTWVSLNSTPLKLRDNLIISETLNIDNTNINNQIIKSFKSIDLMISFCKEKNYEDIWIIGGEKLYSSFLNNENYNKLINKIYLK